MKLGEILMAEPKHYIKKLRPLIAEVGPDMIKNLALLTIADRMGQYNPLQAPAIQEVYDLITLIDEIVAEEGRFTMKQLAVNGTILMEHFNLPAGPKLGALLKQAYERVLEDPTRNNLDTIIAMLQAS